MLPTTPPFDFSLKLTNFGFKRLFCSSQPRVENCNLGNLKPLVRILCFLFWWFHFSFTEIMLSFMGVLYQMLVEIGWYSNNWVLFPLTYDCNEGWKEVWFPSHVYLFFLILCICVADHLIERFFFSIRYRAFFLTQIDINL